MRILHVIRSVDPAGGGPIEGVRQLSAANRAFGHEVEIASLDAPDRAFLKTVELPVHAIGPGSLKYSYTSRLAPWLRENAKKYDIVIVNGIWQYHSLAVWRVLRSGGVVPYVVFTHGMLDPWFKKKYPLKHLKKMMYWPWGEYRVLRDAGAVLFTCEEERSLARQSFALYRCNECVVNYGTAGPTGDPEKERDAFFAEHPELRGKRLAVFMGRLHEKKGCDILIEAFARVLAADPDWRLVMCGPDQVGWQAKLVELAAKLRLADRITWAGMVGGPRKWGALRAAEIFVLPSHQENFGISVAEALACGTPALISNKVNIWREVEKSGAGMVGEDDLAGTCGLLKCWLETTDSEKALYRRRARECFLREFEIKRASETLVRTLRKVIDGRSPNAQS